MMIKITIFMLILYGSTSCSLESVDLDRGELLTLKKPFGANVEVKRYYLNKKGEEILHGRQEEFDAKNVRRLLIEYTDGVRNGRHVLWSRSSGKKSLEGGWENGVRSGRWRSWDEGHLATVKRYKNGLLEGKLIEYRVVSKRIYFVSTYRKGVIYDEIVFHDNGEVKSEGYFQNGKKHGSWIYYDKNGLITGEGTWRNGKPWAGMCRVPAVEYTGPLGGRAELKHRSMGRRVFKQFDNGKKTSTK